jgi:hypothetical protein
MLTTSAYLSEALAEESAEGSGSAVKYKPHLCDYIRVQCTRVHVSGFSGKERKVPYCIAKTTPPSPLTHF